MARNTLSNANNVRDWRLHASFAQHLIAEARDLYSKEDHGLDIDSTVHALDSSTIDLCLSLFPWARFRKTKAAVKLHTLHLHGAHFVLRAKKNTRLRRLYSGEVDRTKGIICDQVVTPDGQKTSQSCPDKLRRIKYIDRERDKSLVFLTNDFVLPALTIAELYQARWQVELFFKWIKQHLRIKSFFGTSENAVKSQIRIAISVHVLVAIIKNHLRINESLHTILQILSLTPFERIPLNQLLTMRDYKKDLSPRYNQLNLFDETLER